MEHAVLLFPLHALHITSHPFSVSTQSLFVGVEDLCNVGFTEITELCGLNNFGNVTH
jgi:hypothetical protein